MAVNRVPYRTSLRVLGRLLNSDKARMVTVCEIDEGFLLHYFVQGDPEALHTRAVHHAEVLDLDDMLHGQRGKAEPSGSFHGLQSILGFRQSEALRFQKSHPLCPMGYEHFFRALGASLDRRHAEAALLVELEDHMHVEYTVDKVDFVVREGQRLALAGRREERYTAAQIDLLVRKGHEHAVEQVRASGQNLAFNPMDVASYLDAALALEDEGHDRDAEDLYRRAAQLAPDHAEAQYHLARHARRRGDRKDALKYVQRAIALRGDDARFLHVLARLHVDRGRLDEAVAALRRAIAADPDNPVYHYELNRVNEQLGHDPAVEASAPLSPVEPALDAFDAWIGPADAAMPAPTPGDVPVHGREESPPDASLPAPMPERTVAPQAQEMVEIAPSAPDTVERAASSSLLAARAQVHEENAAEGHLAPAASVASAARVNPFAAESPSWDNASVSAAAPSESDPGAASPAAMGSTDGLAGDERAGQSGVERGADESGLEGLPLLGLSVANDWSTPALPALHVPSDGAAAAAALPMAVAEVPEQAAPPPASRTTLPAVATMEPAEPTDADADDATEDAVQLAAAIMRAEELVSAEPHRADLHRRLGFLLAKQGRSEEAATAFRRAAECGRRRVVRS